MHFDKNNNRKANKMGNAKADPMEVDEILVEEVVRQVRAAWEENSKMFYRALEDSEKAQIQLVFKVTPDLSEAAPLVTLTLSWKDKAVERGVKVTKSYTSATYRRELEDTNQKPLSLPGEPDPKPKGRKPKK